VVREVWAGLCDQLRRRRPRPGDKWHVDEVFIKIRGVTHYLWRAVDQRGEVLDILVTSRRDARAATRFFRKVLKDCRYAPRVLITDKLRSYGPSRSFQRKNNFAGCFSRSRRSDAGWRSRHGARRVSALTSAYSADRWKFSGNYGEAWTPSTWWPGPARR
jgi:transposase-like protein